MISRAWLLLLLPLGSASAQASTDLPTYCQNHRGTIQDRNEGVACFGRERDFQANIVRDIGDFPNLIAYGAVRECMSRHFTAAPQAQIAILATDLDSYLGCLDTRKKNGLRDHPRAYERCFRLLIGNFERGSVQESGDLQNGYVTDDSITYCEFEPYPYGAYREMAYCAREVLPPPFLDTIEGNASVEVPLSEFQHFEDCLGGFAVSLDRWIDENTRVPGIDY